MIYYWVLVAIMVLVILFLVLKLEEIRHRQKRHENEYRSKANEAVKLSRAVVEMSQAQQYHWKRRIAQVERVDALKGTTNLKVLSAMVEALPTVVNKNMRGDMKITQAAKYFCTTYTEVSPDEIKSFLERSDSKVQLAWKKNTLLGYVEFCERSLDELETQVRFFFSKKLRTSDIT